MPSILKVTYTERTGAVGWLSYSSRLCQIIKSLSVGLPWGISRKWRPVTPQRVWRYEKGVKIGQYSGENVEQCFSDFTLSKDGEGLASRGTSGGRWNFWIMARKGPTGQRGNIPNGTCTVDLFIWGFYIAFNTVVTITPLWLDFSRFVLVRPTSTPPLLPRPISLAHTYQPIPVLCTSPSPCINGPLSSLVGSISVRSKENSFNFTSF